MATRCPRQLIQTSSVGFGLISRRTGFFIKWNKFERWQERVKARKKRSDELAAQRNFIKLEGGMYITPERPEDVLPKKPLVDQTREEKGIMSMDFLTSQTQMRYLDHSIDNIKRYNRYKHFQGLQYDQRFIPERLLFLGADLAAAHFLVHRGAAVKFVGDDSWYKRDERKRYSLPGRKVPDLYIEAIDASGTELMCEAFDNLYDLSKLRMLRLSGCKYMDDWAVGRIGGMFDDLEMLDLSGCNRITAKGLMGLKYLKKLKYLRLDGLDSKNIGHAALLLEETIPGLTVLGVDYEDEMKKLEGEMRMLENPNVVQDARGNAFVEDENGRLFYIAGNVNERPTVCDDDKPIMTSTIRREIPRLSDEDFEKLDVLSGGKLRHLLVGSPSGYEWSETVETILQHEAKLDEKDGIVTDPKMLPKEQRKQISMDETPSLLEEEKKRFLSLEANEWRELEKQLLLRQTKSLEAGKSTVPEAVAKKQSTEHIVPDEFIDKDEGKKRVNE